MKKVLLFVLIVSFIEMIVLLSCKKQVTCEGCNGSNKPPIADAGTDVTITLPLDSVLLNGSKSSDPDGKISSWQWTKISGPDSLTIVKAAAATTEVKNLKMGTYQFELKVIDDAGLSAKDNMQVTVTIQSAVECDTSNRPTTTIQLEPVVSIPNRRYYGVTTAAIGNKLLLAGGSTYDGYPVSDVNIYDFSTQTWSTANLSIGRSYMTSATVDNKIFFAGGEIPGFIGTTRVDIYDTSTNTWSSSDLPTPIYDASIAANENKVFFASNRAKIDVYDISTGFWSEVNLSDHRTNATATTVGNKVYFAGGLVDGSIEHPSNVIDIYDNETGTWSTSFLSQPISHVASIYDNGKIYWAGGVIGYNFANDADITTCKVEIRDVSMQSSSFTNLSEPHEFSLNYSKPIYYNGKIIFWGRRYLEIYDPQSSNWTIGNFPQDAFVESVILVNNVLYAIGYSSVNSSPPLTDLIWKLQY